VAVRRAVVAVVEAVVAGKSRVAMLAKFRVGFSIVALLGAATTSHAVERIVDFHAGIGIQSDGSLFWSETIDVESERDRIRHGIFRDFPTEYRDRHGRRVRVSVRGIGEGVRRDGISEPWNSAGYPGGERFYFGDRNALLPPGRHRFQATYEMTRQVGYFSDYNELYWHVTGNGWDLPIDAASVDISLKVSVPRSELSVEAWTGRPGSTERAVQVDFHDDIVSVRTTRALGPGEGLTVALRFPKGVVYEPGLALRLRWWIGDNFAMLLIVVQAVPLSFFALWQSRHRIRKALRHGQPG